MFQCSFMFTRIRHDDEFQRLDDAIADYARSLEGFLGSDTWFNSDSSQVNGVYFFETMEAVRTFAAFPQHREAKEKYARWYGGGTTWLSWKFTRPTVTAIFRMSRRRRPKPAFFPGERQSGPAAPASSGG